jgi:hypothetical protein
MHIKCSFRRPFLLPKSNTHKLYPFLEKAPPQQTRDRNKSPPCVGARRPDRVTARDSAAEPTAPRPRPLPRLPASSARAHLPNPPFPVPADARGPPDETRHRAQARRHARAVPATPSRSSGFAETTFACASFAPYAHTASRSASTNAITRVWKDRLAKGPDSNPVK